MGIFTGRLAFTVYKGLSLLRQEANPTFNERASIRAATLDYLATGLVDQLIVVNNNGLRERPSKSLEAGLARSSKPDKAAGMPCLGYR